MPVVLASNCLISNADWSRQPEDGQRSLSARAKGVSLKAISSVFVCSPATSRFIWQLLRDEWHTLKLVQ